MRRMDAVTIKVMRLRPDPTPVALPKYQTEHAAGLDLLADVPEPVVLQPFERAAIPTGLAVEIPPGFEGQVRPRSGLALKAGITCLNSPGTIDADYRGEVKVILANLSRDAFTVRRGDRIAQLVVSAVARARLTEVEQLGESTRGSGGFGSTGH